ncbi:MAG: aminotransferase class I/II-fold pyridoxal phosphate-dependent enzyme [Legionellaceae bacterium]|nr:aminotransferase class I/II-fold pyridoxal phosphate-dependent enzyme [Legionellaceae bacterium]
MLKLKLQSHIADAKERGLLRLRSLTPNSPLNFSSNDYLGLTTHTALQTAYSKSFHQYPAGSTGSMLVSGYHKTHQKLEMAFAKALGVEAALLFSSGYAANLSLMQLLATLDIHALIDKSVHASFYDGLHLSGGSYSRYPHNHSTPKTKHAENTVLITESIFSMSGTIPNLQALATHYPLIVDEAHAFGVLGPKGLGCVAEHRLTTDQVPLRIIPLGKALGASGAIVAGDKDWITALLQTARPFIYSTAISPALTDGMLEAFQCLQDADKARLTLQENIQYFRTQIQSSPLRWQDSKAPIQQLQLGCPKKAGLYAFKLQQNNIRCIPMREPTVRRPETGLRIVLNSHHTPDNIQKLFKCLHQCHHSI